MNSGFYIEQFVSHAERLVYQVRCLLLVEWNSARSAEHPNILRQHIARADSVKAVASDYAENHPNVFQNHFDAGGTRR